MTMFDGNGGAAKFLYRISVTVTAGVILASLGTGLATWAEVKVLQSEVGRLNDEVADIRAHVWPVSPFAGGP